MLFDTDYVQNMALSQSDITSFEKDLRQFYHEKIEGVARPDYKSDPMDIGNIVDAKILQPDELKNYYVVTDMKATGKVQEVIELAVLTMKSVFKEREDPFLEWPTIDAKVKDLTTLSDFSVLVGLLDNCITTMEYQLNWKAETRILKILVLGKAYYEQLQECKDRVMIGLEEWNKAHSKVDSIKEDEYTLDLFNSLFEPQNDCITVLKQVALYGEFEGMPQKGMIDFFIQNDLLRTIEPWDLKTAASHQRFSTNYRAKKYGRQGSFYTDLLKQNFPGYTILPFKFLVIPIETDERPEVYEMDSTELYINENGHLSENGYRIKGWKELMREVNWHKKSGKWDHRKDYYLHGRNIINSRIILEADLLQVEESKPLI